ncbi:hypothetical protein NQ314_012846 [Rhamnusium bicolor]|uniref:Uncharacterized protein n=1 Tax=Rhamnusium bicolor TaxID=1586634 RepID=A0AAV8XAI2_9CUCU|nr:hypothetical protein NQ314_012846 [Rhamnusium bicolor]
MAASNAYSLSPESEHFKMPSEPCPLSSFGSDEESFVVLWKDMDSKSHTEENHEPMGSSVVEEAKQLINKELSQMEQLSLSHKTRTSFQTEQCLSLKDQENSQLESSVLPKMEQSTVLPIMPHVERGFVKFFI